MFKKPPAFLSLLVFLLVFLTYANSKSQSPPEANISISKNQVLNNQNEKLPKTPKPPESKNNTDSVLSNISSVVGVIVAIVSLVISNIALKNSKRASKLSHVFELYNAWAGIRKIDPQKPVGPQVVKAANTLNLTSNMWNNNVIEKKMIHQNHWIDFNELYCTLINSDKIPQGQNKKCYEFITPNIKKAYKEMKNFKE